MKTVTQRTPLHPLAWFALIAGGAFAGVFGGLLMHSQLASPEAPTLAEGSTSNAAPDPHLVEALKQLIEELRASRADRSSLEVPASAASQRTVASESGAGPSGDLAAALRELRETIHELRLGRSAATPPALTLPSGGHRNWLPELPAGTEEPKAAHSRNHLLWSEQQVLDAYGLPDEIHAQGNGTCKWFYVDPDRARSFQVHFKDGRVIGMSFIR